jgi:hypothetical protein
MSESQTELRAIKKNLRLYQVNSHPQSQNFANRSIHPFSERMISQRPTADNLQPERPSAKTALATPSMSHTLREPQHQAGQQQAGQQQVRESQFKQPQLRQPQIDLPQINLLPITTASSSLSSLSGSPAQSSSLQSSPLQSSTEVDRIEADVDWEPITVAQTNPTVKRLQQKSVQYLQQFVQPAPDKSNAQIDIALKRLEDQAQQINQLSVTQEAAILELKAIAQQIERDWKTLEVVNAARAGYDASNIEVPAVCEYLQFSVPLVEKNQAGVLVLTERSVDLFKAEREAAMTAQSLRFRTAPAFKPQTNWTQKLRQLLLGNAAKMAIDPVLNTASHPDSSPASRGNARSAQPKGHRRKARSLSFQEGMSLLFGAVLVRVLLNLLLSAHPAFWFPAIALMVTPGAIAVYRSRVTPKLTLTWGYRLIFIMIGFLIGGRL